MKNRDLFSCVRGEHGAEYADCVHGTTPAVDGGRLAVRSARPIGR
jgi:hypothetical protein